MNQVMPIKNRTAAVIQILVLFFVQVFPFFPVFGDFIYPARHGDVCRGDHRLCGCPLERIVSRTCCCFQTSEMATPIVKHPKMKSTPRLDIKRSPRFVSPTCNNPSNLIPGSLEKIKFIRIAAVPEIPYFPLALFLLVSGNRLKTWSKEPPDPPPKFILS